MSDSLIVDNCVYVLKLKKRESQGESKDIIIFSFFYSIDCEATVSLDHIYAMSVNILFGKAKGLRLGQT